jgi:small multidrug resistance family-3 protein
VALCIALFLAAGLCEIVGGWLVWKYRRSDPPWVAGWAVLGSLILVAYGFVPTFQPEQAGAFGRVYAAYGAYFIVLSLGWAWVVDAQRPDTGDVVGACLACVGACVITFWPR